MSARRICIAALALLLGARACSPYAGASDGTNVDVAEAGSPDAASTDAASAIMDATTYPPSCAAILNADRGQAGKSGYFTIAAGDGGPHEVYCDMTIDDGGWTLVGRSGTEVPGTPPPFGWNHATGDVHSTAMPYSLDVARAELAFGEVLVATVDSVSAFKFAVGPTFVGDMSDAATKTGTVVWVAGPCAPPAGPTMLKYLGGAPVVADDFFFRDVPDLRQHTGLTTAGFDLTYSDCSQGGNLHLKQGMLLVR